MGKYISNIRTMSMNIEIVQALILSKYILFIPNLFIILYKKVKKVIKKDNINTTLKALRYQGSCRFSDLTTTNVCDFNEFTYSGLLASL
jgi:hypothetical protein